MVKLVNCFSSVFLWLIDSENHFCHVEDWYFSIQTAISIKTFQVVAPSLFCQKALEDERFPYTFRRDKRGRICLKYGNGKQDFKQNFCGNLQSEKELWNLYFWFRSGKRNIEHNTHGSKFNKSQYIMESFVSLFPRSRWFGIRIGSETCVI